MMINADVVAGLVLGVLLIPGGLVSVLFHKQLDSSIWKQSQWLERYGLSRRLGASERDIQVRGHLIPGYIVVAGGVIIIGLTLWGAMR